MEVKLHALLTLALDTDEGLPHVWVTLHWERAPDIPHVEGSVGSRTELDVEVMTYKGMEFPSPSLYLIILLTQLLL